MKRFVAFAGMLAMTMTIAIGQESAIKLNDHLTVPQWVNPATPGELTGRLILPSTDGSAETIADATIVMTDGNGETLRAKSNDEGEFKFTGVKPGIYALSARADGIFACCAMHVVSNDMASSEMYPKTAEIAAAGIDYSIIKTSIIRYLPPAGKDDLASISTADLKGISSQVVGENLFRVAQTDGGMKGRIHLAGAEGRHLSDAGLLNVFLVHKGETVDRVVSNRDGSFEFGNLEPGEYSILAIGLAGMGMAGFELVDEADASASTAMVGSNGETLVTQIGNDCCCCCPQFSMQVAPLPMAIEACHEVVFEESVVVQETIIDEGMIAQDGVPLDAFGEPVDAFGNPIGGGGFSGGGGYGGGGGGFGGGGGGGLGGIASLAGLGILAATLDDDDDGIFPPAAASPNTP